MSVIINSLRIAILITAIGCLFVASHKINQWERANGYPFGQMCQIDDSCQLIKNRNAIENALRQEFNR